MIEKTVLDYLDTALPVPCYMEKPVHPPESYVLVEKTGSSENNHFYSSTIAVQSYAKSMSESAALNLEVKNAMEGINVLDAISRCKLNSDYNFTDTAMKQYRYQAVFDIHHYHE